MVGLFSVSRRIGWLAVGVLGVLAGACRPMQPAPPGATPSPRPSGSTTTISPALQAAILQAKQQLTADDVFRRNRIASFGFRDDTTSPLCSTPVPTPPTDLAFDDSFWIHDRPTLDWVDPSPPAGVPANFSLRSTLGQLARQLPVGSPALSATQLFAQFWDTQNATGPTSGPHCTANGGTVNGFPVSCRVEGDQANHPSTEIDHYWPIGLVNRIDLAHEAWRNCGEFRIVYGRNDVTSSTNLGRVFMIFEAVLPNPRPGCRSACQPVADFWANLSDPTLSAADRARRLRDFYYVGLPGFDPVVQIDHYTAEGVGSSYGSSGSGQIRTNMFEENPWMMKEFRLSLDCGGTGCDLAAIPTMVKVNPFADLWSVTVAGSPGNPFQSRATAFQGAVLASLGSLTGWDGSACPSSPFDINRIGYPVETRFDAAQSPILLGGSSDYFLPARTTSVSSPVAFQDLLAASPAACGLSGEQLVKRAQAQNCAGCHDAGNEFTLTSPNAIGPVRMPDGTTVTSWPPSLGFVQAQEFPDPVTHLHRLSPALTTAFLPERRRFMTADVLDQDTCPCRQTFASLQPPMKVTAVSIEDKVTAQFVPLVNPPLEQLKALKASVSPKGPVANEARKLRDRLASLELERQAAVVKALAAQKIDLPPLTRQPIQGTRLGLSALNEADPQRAREVRQAAMLEVLRKEPPRRTVSGSFRVH